jgi:alkylated DNA nucleotide flippase Atl1
VEPGLPTPFAERVLDLVDQIPPGSVLAYGDVAELVGGGGPRQVGRVMALWGGSVPWWRVVRASGQPAAGLERQVLATLRAEGAPLSADGGRVHMARGRWVPPRALVASLASAVTLSVDSDEMPE